MTATSEMTNVSVGAKAKQVVATATHHRTVVKIEKGQWTINGRPVHAGSPAEGLLMNVRMVNAVFEDTGQAAHRNLGDFNPDINTNRFIEHIPNYLAHGVRAFTLSFQGGHPGYEGAVNSGFNADGSLRQSYLDRVDRVVDACDQHGTAVILSCFYQRQHSSKQALEGPEAIRRAVMNVARWIKDRAYKNVVLEISNEYAHGGFGYWRGGDWLRSVDAQVDLIRLAKTVAPKLLVSTSGRGDGRVADPIGQVADFILIHFNNTGLEDIPARTEEARRFGKPVICNEDNKIGEAGAEAAYLCVQHGAGWGYMHSEKNQNVPFKFEGAADDPVVYRTLRELTTPGASVTARRFRSVTVLITAPKDGDVFDADSSLAIRVALTGMDDEGTREVHFYANDAVIGKSAQAPWQVEWNDLARGRYDLTAVALSADGEELARSNPVDIEVN